MTKFYGPKKDKRGRQRLRRDILGNYSKWKMICACCGESNYKFLSLDHILEDGAEHRKQFNGDQGALFRDLKRKCYPPGFQVLCYNCNLGRQHNGGICPHEEIYRKKFLGKETDGETKLQ